MKTSRDLLPFAEFSELKNKARMDRYMRVPRLVFHVETYIGIKRLAAMLEMCDELLRNIPMEELKKYVGEQTLNRARKLILPMKDKP